MTSTSLDINWHTMLADADISSDLAKQSYSIIPMQRFRDLKIALDARLMNKLDTLEARPQIFTHQDLSLWPVSNQAVALVKGTAPYLRICPNELKKVAKNPRIIDEKDPNVDLHSLSASDISSEHNLILVLQNARVLSMIHHAKDGAVAMAGGGRQRLPKGVVATIGLRTEDTVVQLACSGVQFETDAIHESADLITMAEAKLLPHTASFSKFSSLHLRQIVFPALWLKDRLSKRNSTKRVEPAVILARPDTKNRNSWTIFWLPVSFSTNTGALKAAVEWDRALCFLLDSGPKTATARPRQRLDCLPVVERSPGSVLPQFNAFCAIDPIARQIGLLAIDSDALTGAQAHDLRTGAWHKHSTTLTNQAQPVPWDAALGAMQRRFGWCPRQHDYLRDALTWLGFVRSWNSKTRTVEATAFAMAYARSDRDVQIQMLWNAMRTSPTVQAAALGVPFAHLPAVALDMDGINPTATTAKRRYQAVQRWVSWLSVEVRRSHRQDWAHMPHAWMAQPA